MSVLEYKKKTNRAFSDLDCHFHSIYEIYYFLEGDADIIVEGKTQTLTPHSLLLIAPHVLHGIRVNSNADYIRYCLFLSTDDILPEYAHILTGIMPDFKNDPSQDVLYENTQAFRLEDFFENLKQLDSQPNEVRNVLEPIFLEALLGQIYLLCNTMRPSTFCKTPSRIKEIVNYINSHLTDTLTLDIIADAFFISKNQLNHTFKQVIGTTVMEYVRLKRSTLARQYMQEGESATSAALHAGFADYSVFYRTYTKFMKEIPSSTKLYS